MGLLPPMNPWGPRANTQRAVRLLLGGAVAMHSAAAVGLVTLYVLRGTPGLVAGIVAFAVVIFSFALGQAVHVALAESDPRVVLAASLVSYAVRIGLIGAALLYLRDHAPALTASKGSFFVAVVGLSIAWIVGEIVAFTQLRFPIYDEEYIPPPVEGGQL